MFDDRSRQMLAGFLRGEKDTRPFAETIGQRAMLLPVAKSGYNNSDVTAMPGLLHDAMQAVMLPKRVYDGQAAPNDVGENLNFTMNMIGGGTAFGRPAGSLGSGGIRAYHGSPHDFDKFDLSKIGTGEGAQAYGHGLYFAENEGVARSYRDTLAPEIRVNGKPMTMDDVLDMPQYLSNAPGWERMLERVRSLGSVDAARAELNSLPDSALLGVSRNRLSRVLDEMGQMKVEPASGRMYEVSIKADPEDFLDWDKPLSQQSDAIRKFAETAPRTQMYDGNGNATPLNDLEGGPFYGALAEALGRPWDPAKPRLNEWLNHPEAANKLREAGIPGIKYLDGGSRGAGEGSRNYVVFDDSLVEILRKYGLAGILAGTGAMASQGNEN